MSEHACIHCGAYSNCPYKALTRRQYKRPSRKVSKRRSAPSTRGAVVTLGVVSGMGLVVMLLNLKEVI